MKFHCGCYTYFESGGDVTLVDRAACTMNHTTENHPNPAPLTNVRLNEIRDVLNGGLAIEARKAKQTPLCGVCRTTGHWSVTWRGRVICELSLSPTAIKEVAAQRAIAARSHWTVIMEQLLNEVEFWRSEIANTDAFFDREGDTVCVFCRTMLSVDAVYATPNSPLFAKLENHKEDCAWRLAMERISSSKEFV